jgi:hypothetical protein
MLAACEGLGIQGWNQDSDIGANSPSVDKNYAVPPPDLDVSCRKLASYRSTSLTSYTSAMTYYNPMYMY